MTEEYKENILKYLTNNVSPTPGENKPIFNSEVLTTSLTVRIQSLLSGIFIFSGYLFDENTQNIIIYGMYGGTNYRDYGFIYMVDRNLNEIQMIKTFSSGTNLFPLYDMQVDENGYLYAISNDTNSTKRILLLNNVFSKTPDGTYQVNLRQSYIIPNSNGYNFESGASVFYSQKLPRLGKVPGEATYYVLLWKGQRTYVLRFTINVGSENEWVFIDTNTRLYGQDFLISKEGENHTLYFYYSNVNNNFNYYEATLKNDTFSVTKTITTDIYIEFCFAKSVSEIYIAGTTSNYSNEKIEKITESSLKEIDSFPHGVDICIQLQKNIVFIFANSKIGILQNDIPYYSQTLDVSSTIVNFFILVSYNLVNIYVATAPSRTTKFTLDYNANNYNGEEYEDYNQTLGTKARLYSNGQMVFARNLYNTTLLGNIATSNLQVPNTLINGIPIVVEGLIGATNGVLITDTTPIVKNIYETLYVNFIRSINVIDEDTNTQYPGTANYVNQNINTATEQNCTDTFVGKVKINYTSNSIVQEIRWNYVTDHYETSFVIDATSEVPTIEFLSNDETMIYITKELDISTGHYYKVSQKLRIE